MSARRSEKPAKESSPAVTLNIEWLSDCAGCHVAIVDLHEKILTVLQSVSIQRCPVLTDIKDYPKATVGIVSGAIRTEHDRHAAEAMRKSCDLIIAMGSCAVYGGIAGAGNVHTREEIFDAVYANNKTTIPGATPKAMVSPLEATVTPLDSVIDVDLYLPGCAPHPAFIFDGLLALLEGRTPKATKETVCSRCKRAMEKTDVERILKISEGIADPDRCFLSQGYICMGSVTLDRCMSPCPQNGVTCTGCAGATMQVLTEPNRDIRTEIGERMAKLTKIPKDTIIREIERTSKSHYSYTMATSMIGEKPTFLIKKWIGNAEADYE
ncbi:methyl viologen-reducing hydrogenase [Geobacter pelophilus]|jgi:F420-non-reducing hydrogenase small subunit|uniref:Methyl viologen-reducing hydrogenase n=1 Tax=Geoanaerobacter pelophilus TaxID=60036 RepID=A0AAW4KZS1_9BACT|nr:methyl viologen-reducing hydrogenase [Geoanaerobacter pelophilus]MBT0664078.1 methyl viologen-reducing hydrogenase [Geoanaerobacter pelophilus]